MARLLAHKGSSGGLNSIVLDGQNIHVVLNPPFPKEACGRVIIASDLKHKFLSYPLTVTDINYAFFQFERFKRSVFTN